MKNRVILTICELCPWTEGGLQKYLRIPMLIITLITLIEKKTVNQTIYYCYFCKYIR